MPGMDGFEICRRLRADPSTRDVPVMFLSAGGEMADKVEGFRAGGVDYVTKPFQVEEVLARVATHLALSRQRREIAALSDLKDQLIRTISHDLKNPLTIVLGSAEYMLLAPKPLTDEHRHRLVGDIHRRGQEMLRLVTDLLDLSRIEEGMPLQLARVDLGEVAQRHVEDARERAQAAGVSLRFEGPADPVAVAADGERLQQVLANLVSNALKYTPAGGEVVVSVGREGTSGLVRVSDTGLGIPAPALARVFEPFYRVDDAAHRKAEGTGLGLSIVKALVTQHGGDVRVESTPGSGSVFIVALPIAP
jgi:signal transduction histidine kinase